MVRAASWLLVVALSGCGGGQVSPAQEQPSRFADYDDADATSTPASDSQCDLPVAQRDQGWFCYQDQ